MSARKLMLLALGPLALGACSDGTDFTTEDFLLGVSMTEVRGVVLDASTGEPLPGAVVQLVDRGTLVAEDQVLTNLEGRFRAQSADAMDRIRVDVSHPARIITGHPVFPVPAYRVRRVAAEEELEIRLTPMSLLVLNLAASSPLADGARLEISIDGAPPLLYSSGDVPRQKFAGVPSGETVVTWRVTGPGGDGRSGSTVAHCGKFEATEVDVSY